MSLTRFLRDLETTGHIVFETGDAPCTITTTDATDATEASSLADADRDAARGVLREAERDWSAHLAGEPPEFDLLAGEWAASVLHLAARLVVFRDPEGPELVSLFESRPAPEPNARSVYSIDVTLRHLPDLRALVVERAPADPLIDCLDRLARAWPLSSVGVPGLETDALALDPVLEHRTLTTLYLDRIVSRRDTRRLDEPRVRRALELEIGERRELCPDLVRLIERASTPLDPSSTKQ